MSMLNPLGRLTRRDGPKPTLRERAAALKATAARVMRRRPADQPSPTSLPRASAVDQPSPGFTVAGATFEHPAQELPGTSSRDHTAAGQARQESTMGRHETFENGIPLADELLAGTILGRHQDPDPIFAVIKAHSTARSAFEETVRPADEVWVAVRGGDTSPEGMAPAQEAYRRADAAETRAWNDLFLVRPTTQAGLVALIFHAREFVSEQDGDDLISLRDIFTALAACVRAVPVAATVPSAGRSAAVSPALADLIARHRIGLAYGESIADSADDETHEAVDIAAWDLAHEAFKLPIAGPADLSAKLELAAPEIDAALDDVGHSLASHAWNCMRADLLGAVGAPTATVESGTATRNPEIRAAEHDLSACTLPQLARLYETWESVYHHLTAACSIPCFSKGDGIGATPAGSVLDREYDRAGAFLSVIEEEARRRVPQTGSERNERLNVLVRAEMNTNGRPVDVALLAALNAALAA